jgi:peroxiredoxin
MPQSATYLKKPHVVIAFAVALVLLGGLVFTLSNQSPHAPEVSFTLIDGSNVSLADLQGKPVLVSFWSTTCKICIAKTPEMNAIYNKLHPLGFEMVAVAMPYDPPTRVVEFAKKLAMPYPVALDHQASIVRAFGNVRVTPTNFLISPDGRIAWRRHGELDTDHLRGTIEQMLQKQRAKL